VRGVDRGLSLLSAVCEAGRISLTDAARATGIAVSTALRILRTLEAAGFVSRDAAAEYGPGPRMIQLGAMALSDQHLADLARPGMERLADATGESAYLAIRGHGAALYLAIVEGAHSVRHVSWVGRTVPLAGSAVGAALRGEVPAGGFAVVRSGVEADITAIAAPIRLRERVVAAVSLLIPAYRADQARVDGAGELLTAVTDELSAALLTDHRQLSPALMAPAPAPSKSDRNRKTDEPDRTRLNPTEPD
jgi:DNA-binding IclR family transcriptional regulator